MLNIDELKFDAQGLIPAIVVDAKTKKVLTLAYMNRESLAVTMEKGLTCFWSRSRQELWLKGETSGNFLHVVEMFADCDGDTLLIKARPDGPTCHRGTTACFDTRDNEGFLGTLEACIKDRHAQMPEGSYTTYLFNKGVNKIAQKVGEEAVETVIEAIDGNRERYLYEAGDLLYHLLVLTEQMGCSLSDLEDELAKRHK